jgi:hypothetical protein
MARVLDYPNTMGNVSEHIDLAIEAAKRQAHEAIDSGDYGFAISLVRQIETLCKARYLGPKWVAIVDE